MCVDVMSKYESNLSNLRRYDLPQTFDYKFPSLISTVFPLLHESFGPF